MPGYSYTIISENNPSLRPKIDKSLVNKSPAYEFIKKVKKRDKSALIQSIYENRQALVESTIIQGLTKGRPFAECKSSFNLDPENPALVDLEDRYSRYSQRLTQIPVKKLITKAFPPIAEKENAHSPQVLKDYRKRVKPLANQPLNSMLTKFDWAHQINKGLDPHSLDADFFRTKGNHLLTYYRDQFLRADLAELAKLQQICQVAIDLDEIERLLSGPKPKKLTEMMSHPGYIALLRAYQTIFRHAQEQQIELPKTRISSNDKLIYLNYCLNGNQAPSDPHLSIFKSITHQIKDEYELELNQEIKIIRELIRIDFSYVVNQLREPAFIERNSAQLHVLLKEQKKHTFMRFMQLPHYYSSFCNTANAIAKYLSKEHAQRGVRYMELMRELISFQSKPSEETDQGYRTPHFMDSSPKPKEASETYIKDLNIALKEVGTPEQPVMLLERAHTLPFPGAFSWGPTKILPLLEPEEMLREEEAMIQNIYCPADLYFALKNRTLSQKEFEARVIEHLDQKAIELQSAPSILHYALLFTHVFYLRLHSETELLPDLINHQLDNLSEWYGAPFKSTYKEALGECLIQLLQQAIENDGIDHDAVVRALNAWYTGPIVVRTKEALEKHQENTPLNHFMRIAIAQIHQSLLQILVEPDQIQALESTWSKKPKPEIQLIRV